MEDKEREETLYHGTTYDVAQQIVAQKKFELQETYFATTKALAELFAHRSSRRRSNIRKPALIRVVLYESDFKEWKRNNLIRSIGFDEGDHPELRGKTQLIFNSEAMRHLNVSMFTDELTIESVSQGE